MSARSDASARLAKLEALRQRLDLRRHRMSDQWDAPPKGLTEAVNAAPQRYRKKPVEIEAIQWTGDNLEEVLSLTGLGNFLPLDPEDRIGDPEVTAELYVNANGRWLPITDGEWIAKDRYGCYPIKHDVFAESYEVVSDDRRGYKIIAGLGEFVAQHQRACAPTGGGNHATSTPNRPAAH